MPEAIPAPLVSVDADSARRATVSPGSRLGPELEYPAAVRGILKIAYKLLVNDKGKFAALLMGITFAVFLMIQVTSMFAGMMLKASATVTNTGAKVWVMDRAVNNVASSIPMPDYVLDSVRSMSGVRYAVPLYSGGGLARLRRRRLPGRDGPRASTTPACLDARSWSKGASRTSTPKMASSSSPTRSSPSSRTRPSGPNSRSTTTAASSSAWPRSRPAGCSESRRSTPPSAGRCSTSRRCATRSPSSWSNRPAIRPSRRSSRRSPSSDTTR